MRSIQPNLLVHVMETLDTSWRDIMSALALPGFAIAFMMLTTVRDPRFPDEGHDPRQIWAKGAQGVQALLGRAPKASSDAFGRPFRRRSSDASDAAADAAAASSSSEAGGGWFGRLFHNSSSTDAFGRPYDNSSSDASSTGSHAPVHISSTSSSASTHSENASSLSWTTAAGNSSVTHDSEPAASAHADSSSSGSIDGAKPSTAEGVMTLLSSASFMTVTAAAAMNDVGSTALLAFHSTFYERIFHLDASEYTPMLAAIMPIGGIIGGVGGGLLADR